MMWEGRQGSVGHLDRLKHRRSWVKCGRVTNPISVTMRDVALLLNISIIKKMKTCV